MKSYRIKCVEKHGKITYYIQHKILIWITIHAPADAGYCSVPYSFSTKEAALSCLKEIIEENTEFDKLNKLKKKVTYEYIT